MHWEWLLALGIGVVSGVLNTLASGGSAVALPLLIGLGLPPAVANATNRLPVVFAYGAASVTFARAGMFAPALLKRVLPPTIAGGLIGAWLADFIDHDRLTLVINAAILISLLLLFTAVQNVLQRTFDAPPRYRWQDGLCLFLVGIWLGLIVIDGATYLLLVLILGMHLTLQQANAYKALIGLLINIVALVVFARDGNVDWALGGFLAAGSVAGGFLGARLSLQPWIKPWTYRLLIVVMVFELIHMVLQYWHRS